MLRRPGACAAGRHARTATGHRYVDLERYIADLKADSLYCASTGQRALRQPKADDR